MVSPDQELLLTRLARYPIERYPVQHATTQFHLGSLQLHSGETDRALVSLTLARDTFDRAGMHLERAKSTVMLGAALRTAGRGPEAAAAFLTAASDLAALDQTAEQAAACYNLALVRQDAGDPCGARSAWAEARELFLLAGHPSRAAAAVRDHGSSLLASGDFDVALPLLEQALMLAEQSDDGVGVGAAANALGLAHLATEHPRDAVLALRRALAAFPRGVRPQEHAMVKANLAVAHAQAGDLARARLAAVQALAVPGAAAPVRVQAQALLDRSPGLVSEDLLDVLDIEDPEQWVVVLREEVLRWSTLPAAQRRELVGAFLDGLLARPRVSYTLAESLLHTVVEQPPRTYDLLVSTMVDAVGARPDPAAERLRAVIGSAAARFAMPQWQRLIASLNAAACVSGQPATWT